MKRKILAASLIVMLMAILAGGTAAAFTVVGTARNVITTGNISVTINETALIDDNEVPFTDVTGVVPGTVVSKIVRVENTGDNPAFIRVAVKNTLTFADGTEDMSDLSFISFDYDTANWTLKDGYWYYNKALEPGMSAEPLFTEVSFDGAMGNIYTNSTLVVDVTVFAVQTANNGSSPLSAAGWPAV